ncbi:MAG: DUF3857 domain-containing protein [Bacteroidales bacterium]|nr:DUF3857 domain-containing protein [Bacteroidales bacterium]
MKRIIPYILIVAVAALFNSCDKPTEEQKQADALFQRITKVYTLNPDGSMDYRYQHELDLHTHYAFNRLYGETFIVYNPEHQTLEVNRSETQTAEGEMVASPDNAFNEVLPRFAAGAPPYHHLREMVVTHTGLEKNSTIFVDYNLHSEAGYKPFLMENAILAESSPVRELVIKVRFPKDKDLNYQLLHAGENLNISNNGDMKEYKWVFKDLEATSKEDHQPAYHEHLPRLIFSTANFKDATSWFMDQYSYSLPSSADASLDDVLKDKENRMDSILALQDMVVNHVNHFDIPMEYKGYTLHSNEQVLENNGGTTFEKTLLLASLLKKAGIQEAQPLTIVPDTFYSQDIGDLNSFREYYVKVPQGNHSLYLSALEQNHFNSLYEHAAEVNVYFDKASGSSQVERPDQPISKHHLKGSFTMKNKRNIQGEVSATLTHCENPYLTIQKEEQSVKSMLSSAFPASGISEFEVQSTSPAETRVDYKINQELSPQQQNGYRFISIPQSQTGLEQWHMGVLTNERTTPVGIGWPLDIRYQYTLAYPEALELVSQPVSIEKDTEVGMLKINIRKENREVRIDRQLQIEGDLIAPEKYADFREMLNLWKKDNYRTLTFKENKK